MNILRFIVNANSELGQPVKSKDENKMTEEGSIITEYENKISELEKVILEQQKIINELKTLIYNMNNFAT
jgi:hypothetical protein